MSTTVERGVRIQPNNNEKMVNRLQKQSSSKRSNGNATFFSSRSCSFRLQQGKEFYPFKYLRFLGGKIVEAIQNVSGKRSSSRVSSERAAKQLVAPPLDFHRAEAIDDCIQFINSSSSLPRSNSVSC